MNVVFCSQCPAVWSFMLTAFLGLWSQQVSAVSVVPIPKIAAVGENVLLSVDGVSGDIEGFNWYKGESINTNQMLRYNPFRTPPETVFSPYEGRVRGFPNGSMEISGVNIKDNGSYTVQIQTNIQDVVATVTITVYEKLSKPSVTANLTHPVEQRDSLALTCGTSIAAQTVLWFKDSQRLTSDDRMSLSQENRTLTISNVSTTDSGNYQCEVMNPVSHSTSDPYKLIVYSLPVEQHDNMHDNTWQTAVGVTIGAVLGAALLTITAVLYKKGCNCQRKGNDAGGNIYEVPDVSGVPPHQYSNIIPQRQEGIYINTLNPKAPDSTYTDLLFRNQSVYNELKK
uniref:Carcinoembryonic antigen-related cell adhesion molecule 1-like isoform X2 n=1 Tax=Geotrypetes seraphini TaxID=260995 RepID=A0A6P8SXU5_GEOSA|nr:carcinoembryonic antigen-related cell adhesion molecule 1-like isoform X2 [Geotrypetes seraphini]